MAELQLIVNNSESADANIAVRWCVKQALIDQLKARRVQDPYVVLVVAYEDNKGYFQESSRYVVPVDQLMQYISFSRPGKNVIFAVIVDGESGPKKVRQQFFEKRSDGEYRELLISESRFTLRGGMGATELEIMVSERFFAKPPSKREMKWLMWCLESAPKNQCEVRKRRMHAYSWQPILYVLFFSAVFIIGWFLQILTTVVHALCLRRGINWFPVFLPWRTAWIKGRGETFHPNLGTSIMLTDRTGKDYDLGLLILPLVPVFPVFLVGVAALLYLFGWGVHSWRGVGAVTLLLWIGLPILVALFGGALGLLSMYNDNKPNPSDAYYEKLAPLVSCGNNPVASIDALPAKRRTIYLRLQDLKAKVCRPLPQ